jgi:hypothetical protein
VGDSRCRRQSGVVVLSISLSRSSPPPLAPFPLSPLDRTHAPRPPIPRATDAHTHTHAMAGRDPDDHDGAPAPPAVFVCGLEVGLLDAGRLVALNGYAHEFRRLPFVSRVFRREGRACRPL